MATNVGYVKGGIKLNCSTSLFPAPRPQSSYPIPNFPNTANSLLALSLYSVSGQGASGIRVAPAGALPGNAATVWTLFHLYYQGTAPATLPTADQQIVTTSTVNGQVTFSTIQFASPMNNASHFFWLQSVDGTQTKIFPQCEITTPLDATLGSISALGTGNSLTVSQQIEVWKDYAAVQYDQTTVEAQCVTAGVAASLYTTASAGHLDFDLAALYTYLHTTLGIANPPVATVAIVPTTWAATWNAVFNDIQALNTAITNAVQGGVNNINSPDYVTPLDQQDLMTEWKQVLATQTALDAQATSYSVSHTTYDAAVTALSTNLISSGAPSNWASIWPNATTYGPWTGVVTNLATWLAAIATTQGALVTAIATAAALPGNTANTVVAQQNSASYMTNSDKIGFVAQWVAESNTQTALDAQAVAAGVSPTAYDNAVSNVSTGLITAGAPANWASIWPDGTTSGPWTNVLLTLNSLWASVATQRATLQRSIASAGEAAAQAAAISAAATDATNKMNTATTNAYAASPTLVSGLPTLPSASYPINKMVFDSVTNKLYSNVANVWKAAISNVNAGDISGTLTAAQVASLAASQITGQLTAAQIASITASQLTGQITGTQITNGAVSTPQLAAGAVTAAQIAAGTITAGQLGANSVTTTQLAAGSVTAGIIAANTITAGQIAAGTITAGQLAANSVTTTQLAAGSVTAGIIAANTITAGQIAAGAIGAQQIAAGAVLAGNLTVANFDNLVPNPNSALLGPFPSGAFEGNGLTVNSNVNFSSPGNYGCRVFSWAAGTDTYMTLAMIPVQPGEVYYAECNAGFGSYIQGPCRLTMIWDSGASNWVADSESGDPTNWCTVASPKISLTATVPAGTTRMRLVIHAFGTGNDNNAYFNNFYLRKCSDAKVIVDGSITTTKLVANAVMTSNFATDTGQTAASLGNTGIPSGNPTGGAWLGVGSSNPMWIGPGGMRVGAQNYGGGYSSYSLDASVVMSFNVVRTNYSSSAPPANPRFWYAGNNDGTTNGGAPNLGRLTATPTVWDTTNHIVWLDLAVAPSSLSDNLDSLRYATVQFYRQSAAGTTGTLTAVGPLFKIPLADRLYFNASSDGDAGNVATVTASAVHSGVSGGVPAAIITLYNAAGPSASNCYYSAAGWAAGTALINNGTSFPSGLTGGGSGGSGGGGGGHIGCVPAGTPLLMADGSWMPIEQAGIGMDVAAWDDQTLQAVPARIARTFVFEDRSLWRIVTADGELVCSHDHRILQGAAWVPARKAVVGIPTLWRLTTGELVYSTILEAAPTGELATVYHVGLDHGHVYCAGAILAHNMKAPSF